MNPPSSGPATDATPKTDPIRPMYRPRSRGGTMSPMIACAPTIKPPAPIPCSARKPISCPIDCESPASIEPTRKITIAARKTGFRPRMSPSFPYSGVEIVDASR